MEPSDNFYELLGVSETATDEEIRRAYVRQVRRFRPDLHPERFQRLNDARDILIDPQRRREYDQLRQHGEQIQQLTEAATALMEEDAGQAARLLKEAVALAPELPMPRFLLAQALLHCQDFLGAEQQFRRLSEAAPNDASYLYHLGGCLKMQARYDEAISLLQQALERDPLLHSAWCLLAEIHVHRQAYSTAIECLERAIFVDERETLGDTETLARLAALHLFQGHIQEAEAVLHRLFRLATNGDSANFVSASLYNEALALFRAQYYSGAYELMRRAAHPLLQDPELRQAIIDATGSFQVHNEAARFVDDPQIPGPIQKVIAARFFGAEGDADRDKLLTALMDAMYLDPVRYQNALRHIRRTYPALCAAERQGFELLEKMAAELLSSARGSVPEKPGCLPAVLLVLTAITVFLAAVLLLFPA